MEVYYLHIETKNQIYMVKTFPKSMQDKTKYSQVFFYFYFSFIYIYTPE